MVWLTKSKFLSDMFRCGLFLAVILGWGPSAAHALTVQVPANYSTIQAAVNAAQANSEIHEIQVSGGTYVENISISGKNDLAIIGGFGGATTIEPANLSLPTISCLSCPFLHIESMTIKGCNSLAGGKATISLQACGSFYINSCVIGTQEFPNAQAIKLTSTAGGLVNNCQIRYGDSGVMADSSCYSISVKGCTFRDLVGTAVNLDGDVIFYSGEVDDNEIYDCGTGISVSGDYSLSGNNCHDNLYNYGIFDESVTAGTDNLADGRPVYVLRNTAGAIIPTNAGYVALFGCANMTITGLTLSHNVHGVYLSGGSNITVTNTTVSHVKDAAISIKSGSNHTVSNCHLTNSYYYGLNVVQSWYFTASGNSMTGNYTGCELYESHHAMVTGNTVTGNDGYGLNVEYSNGSTLQNNVVSNNAAGMDLDVLTSATVSGNTADSNGTYGLRLDDCSGTFRSNSMSGNAQNLYVWDSDNNEDMDASNTVGGRPVQWLRNQTGGTVPAGAGMVILDGCTGVTVQGQTLTHNSHGVLLNKSVDCIIKNMTLTDNTTGVELWGHCDNTLITKCTMMNNTRAGVGLNYNYGTNNVVAFNRILDNKKWGVEFMYSSSWLVSNSIYGNDIRGNAIPGGGGGNLSAMYSEDIFQSPTTLQYVYNGSRFTGYIGNRYGDYTGSDANNDGIGDTNYGPGGRGTYPALFDPTQCTEPFQKKSSVLFFLPAIIKH